MIPYIKDEEELERELEEAKERVVLICLTSKLNQSCMHMDTSVEEQSNEFKNILFFKVDVEDVESNSLVERCAPEVMPLFIFFKKGKEIDRVRGANEDELRSKVEKYSTICELKSLP